MKMDNLESAEEDCSRAIENDATYFKVNVG